MEPDLVSVSGVHKLPNELIVDILQSVIGGETPSQHLATVCKRWKALQLNNPLFWQKLGAYFVDDDQLAFHASRLQRRLELSQETLIHITLDVSAYQEGYSKLLFEILGTADV